MFRSSLTIAVMAVTGLFFSSVAYSNGCIVVRSGGHMPVGMNHNANQFQLITSYRYLFSDRHFRGREEEEHRQDQQTDVRNSVHTTDITLAYRPNERWVFSAALPYLVTTRTSLYEHDRADRYGTGSSGIGDLRLMAYRETMGLDPEVINGITFGFGIKFPTGEEDAKDYFHTADGLVLRTVDQSIQPGDGGTGFIAEIQAYRQFFSSNTFGFLAASYLFNPEDTNGVETNRSRSGEEVMSIPDSYFARIGLSHQVSRIHGLTIDGGFRIEGVPAEDLIGDDNGFRRPGHAIYFEPALTFQSASHGFNLSVPVTIERNRIRSVTDKANGVHGDAAFADYLILTSYSYRW